MKHDIQSRNGLGGESYSRQTVDIRGFKPDTLQLGANYPTASRLTPKHTKKTYKLICRCLIIQLISLIVHLVGMVYEQVIQLMLDS